MFITNMFIDKPVTILVVFTIIMIILSLSTFLFGYFTMSPQSIREYLIYDKQKAYDFDL